MKPPGTRPEDRKLKSWKWPYAGRGELRCPHKVGHGPHLHSCDGCCSHPSFDVYYEKHKKKGVPLK